MLMIENGDRIPCICVTNRRLCKGDFLQKIKSIGEEGKADVLILREKDLSEKKYFQLAKDVRRICEASGLICVLHTFYRVAAQLGCQRIHLPFGILSAADPEELRGFKEIGTSVHSVEQVEQAESLGVSYLIAGHVFETDCKKGIPGRGDQFVYEICQMAHVPVYGIGGITKDNAKTVIQAGAEGVCIMSGFMGETR